jgi:hypothetical protein
MYQWQEIKEDGNWGDIENTTQEFIPEVPGNYRVQVFNRRNKRDSNRIDSAVCRVTYAPEAFNIGVKGNMLFEDNALSAINCPTIEITTSTESDSYIVTWNKVTNSKIENEVSKPVAWEPLVSIESNLTDLNGLSFNPNDYLTKLAEINQNIIGDYLVTITNKLNGATAESEAVIFRIVA